MSISGTVNYAIMRHEKLKKLGSIAASAEHTFRERFTMNADAKRTPLNMHIGAQSSAELLSDLEERWPVNRRSDAVLLVEYFFGASRDWWLGASGEQRAEFFRRCQLWLSDTYGDDNVRYYGTQMDELTPHAVAYVTPIRDGRLNAKSWLGGKEKLRKMQDSFAAAVADLGLQRGVQGSDATHERVQRFYGTLRDGSAQARDLIDEFEPEGMKNEDDLHRYSRALELALTESEIEAATLKKRREKRIADELHRRTGLRLASWGTDYVGKITSLAKEFCIQKVSGLGYVLHSLKRFAELAWHEYLGELYRDGDTVMFRYDSKGEPDIREVSPVSNVVIVKETGFTQE